MLCPAVGRDPVNSWNAKAQQSWRPQCELEQAVEGRHAAYTLQLNIQHHYMRPM